MKILFYNHTGQVSGAERVLLMILKNLDRQIFDPIVVCPSDGRLTEMVSEVGAGIIHIDSLTARFTWRVDHLVRYLVSFVGVIRAARAIVRTEAPDLIHANSVRAGLVMSAATLGMQVPIVWHAHDILPRHPLSTAIRLVACAMKRSQIIFVSRAAAARFRGVLIRWLGGGPRISIIHNAVDSERFKPDAASRIEIRRELGIAERERVIGIVGHLTPNKGQLELIEAFAAASREHPETVLLVIGETLFNRGTDYVNSLTSAADSFAISDRVQFLGPRDDMPALMRGFDLLVVNSISEAFPLAVLEAMASGTPVLATAVGGIPEMIRHGHSGWLVPPRDHLELVKGLNHLISDDQLRRTLGENGRRDAVNRFTIDRFRAEIHAVYQSVRGINTMPQSHRGNSLQTELRTG